MGDESEELSRQRAEDRMTDGGIFIIGDKVIHDGEAEKYGGEKKTTIKRRSTWPDSDDE